jgi:CBS domain containing-hemolysin-like protein
LLTWRARQVTGYPTTSSMGRLGVGSLGAAIVSGWAMFLLANQFDHDRWSSLLAVVVAGVLGLVVFVLCIGVFAGLRPRHLVGRAGGSD